MAIINGDAGDNTLDGTNDPDIITGVGGNDVINGLGGDDQLFGGEGDDALDGGDGSDFLIGEAGRDTLLGGAGRDQLDGGQGDDIVRGGDGDDNLSGGLGGDDHTPVGSDQIFGDAGDDFIIVQERDNAIDGGIGFDTVTFGALNVGLLFEINAGTWQVGSNNEGAIGAIFGNIQNVESVEGTQGDDEFRVDGNFTADSGDFINIRPGAGNDSIDVGGALGDVTVRVDYRTGQSGVVVDLGGGFARSAQPGDAANIGNDTLNGVTQVRGSQFGDQLFGSDNDVFESFRPESGNDFVDGRGGTDRIDYRNAPSGVTVDMSQGLTTDDGAGFIDVFQNIEEVRGSRFADTITGDDKDNAFQPRAGDDIINGGGGFDVLDYRFETGNGIQINLGATSTVTGDANVGTDTVTSVEGFNGTSGNDTFTADGNFQGSIGQFNRFEGLQGDDTINGNGFTRIEYDRSGTAGIFADLQAGVVTGDAEVGRDTVSNIFEVRGTDFDDIIFGSNNNPTIGFESFDGRGGDDLIFGRGGQDRVNYFGADAGVTVDLSAGIARDGRGGTDSLFSIEDVKGTNSADFITGDAADNTFEPMLGGGSVDGLDGNDTISFDDLSTRVDIDLRQGTARHEDGATVALSNIENAIGTSATEQIIGDGDDNAIEGLAGDDRLVGLAGNDEIEGGAGDDVIFGNSGADLILGGDGDDRIIGGFGADRMEGGRGGDVYFVDDLNDEIVEMANGGDVENVFSTEDHTLDTAVENLILIGGGAINGTGNGNANVISGNDAANVINGLGNDDLLEGGGGDDILNGGNGLDRLIDGPGADIMTGGAGSDIFVFRADGEGGNRVTDFETGADKLDVSDFGFASPAAVRGVLSLDPTGAGTVFAPLATIVYTIEGVLPTEILDTDFII